LPNKCKTTVEDDENVGIYIWKTLAELWSLLSQLTLDMSEEKKPQLQELQKASREARSVLAV